MSNEQETKKILQFRESMKERIQELQHEIQDLQNVIEELDKLIVTTGFRTFSTSDTSITHEKTESEHIISQDETVEDQTSITSKNGTILGKMKVVENTIIFTPSDTFEFTLSTPPFMSFLVERVLDNMRKTDQERATNGELDPAEILEYEIQDQDSKITRLLIHNYGGERRLREINSSLRWTFDKMYDKLTQG
jgi:hypothetical protein